MLIMGLRDHAFAKAPYLLADSDEERANLSAEVIAEAERALVGETEGDAWHPTGGAVIDPDVLWSCVNCGACVEQCPVDIEHVDHIDDMRRYQVLVESNFPTELNNIFKGLERKGNPWGMDPTGRMDWAKNLDFPVKQVGVDVESLDEVEWLFWVGCAGAFEDRAKKTTQAVAELLNMAGVDFAVLGDGETCTGDPARRAGNEIVFMQLAMENAEVFKETKVKKVVSTCAHCFNTLKNEYAEFGVELEVVHHTQLLNRLVQEKKLTPIAPTSGAVNGTTITYHDPCFLGRHNKVYAPPRELLEVIPGATFTEMPRNSERSFCCGGGGARMWMEETIGSRINTTRTEEAVATGADQIAVGCPFCRVMLTDGLTAQQAEGKAREEVEVLDVAQMLLASVKRDAGAATEAEPDAEDRADDASISSTATAAPAADAHLEGDTTEPSGSDQEDAAKHNVALDDEGGGHEMSDADEDDEPAGEDVPAVEEIPEPDPEPEPGDVTEADDESVPEEAVPESGDEPEIPAKPDDDDESPAEEVTHVPDETEPVEEESREEEADMVPFSDPQPSSSEVSDKATELATDDDETPKNP
jgi:Fe-S oxidoreductase